ncbi:MAG: hypothetical protein DI570_24255 [Phenylobacterium zucineum]|nr:MAG: hypothetical protein DI570_24255 [Phenylobacterium zucineum]
MLSRAEMIREGIGNCAAAATRAVNHKTHADPAIRDLAIALHFVAVGAQQIGLALIVIGRRNDLPR